MDKDLIPLAEARRRLGVSKPTMARLAKEGRFPVYENPLDRRQKLVDWAEVEAATRPRRPSQVASNEERSNDAG